MTELKYEEGSERPENFDGKLGDRINQIVETLEEIQSDSLRHKINIDKEDLEAYGRVYIRIEPITSIFNEGELGSDHMVISLGKRGGVHMATRMNSYTSTDFSKQKHPFKRTLRGIEVMN